MDHLYLYIKNSINYGSSEVQKTVGVEKKRTSEVQILTSYSEPRLVNIVKHGGRWCMCVCTFP